MTEYLIDTNVLVYAYDPTEPVKSARARAVIATLAERGAGSLTAQVLGEFFRVVTRKIPNPLNLEEAERSVTTYVRTWRVLDVTGWTALEAVRGVRRYQLPLWDSMIWASAKQHQVPNVLSEDFNTGALIEGVRFVNPFVGDFDAEHLSAEAR